MWRKSGIQQALRDIQIPESPSFQPIWSHVKPEVGEVDIEILDPKTRAALAAHIIPGKILLTAARPRSDFPCCVQLICSKVYVM